MMGIPSGCSKVSRILQADVQPMVGFLVARMENDKAVKYIILTGAKTNLY
jgi:hypothetical protein